MKQPPFSTIEKLFLAAQLYKAQRGAETEAVHMQHALYGHYVGRKLDRGRYGFDASTPITTLREKLREEAQAWRVAGCPL